MRARAIEAITPVCALAGPAADSDADGQPLDDLLDEFARADAQAESWAARQAAQLAPPPAKTRAS